MAGRATGKRKRTSAETQELIRREARRIFNRKGYVAMTLREVAAGVGIEAQSLYNYTSSKQDLVVSLLREGTDAIQRSVDVAIAAAGPEPVSRLYEATRAHTFYYAADDKVMLVRDALEHLDADRRADLVAMLKRYENTFKAILVDGVERGAFREVDVTPTCFAILGLGESVVNWFDRGRRLSADAVSRMYADMAVRSVVAPSEPDSG